MASLNIIDNYKPVLWHNYLPPSIDQDNLNHLETNLELNRDTINEIIKNLGIKPDGVSAEDQNIYDSPIYETLINFKNELKRLEQDKLDKTKYNSDLGDITQLQGGSNLVSAINNRLRRDIDDSSQHTYTFKKLVLTNGTSEALNITGSATITKGLKVGGITSSGKVTVTHTDGIETTKLRVNNETTFASTLTVGGLLTANGGIKTNGDQTTTGKITTANLTVNTKLVSSNVTEVKTLSASGTISTTSTITANGDIRTRGAFRSTAEFIEFHWEQSPLHKLYVHGSGQSLGSGDAFIQTVS